MARYFTPEWSGWTYPAPDAYFPAWARARWAQACSVCGAPVGAGCVTRRGDRTVNHRGRGRQAWFPPQVLHAAQGPLRGPDLYTDHPPTPLGPQIAAQHQKGNT
jgi:hypothetical protein